MNHPLLKLICVKTGSTVEVGNITIKITDFPNGSTKQEWYRVTLEKGDIKQVVLVSDFKLYRFFNSPYSLLAYFDYMVLQSYGFTYH